MKQTAIEKAEELVLKFAFKGAETKKIAVESALIVVDEILQAQPSFEYWRTYDDETPSAITFWNEVKQELLSTLEYIEYAFV